MIEGDLDLIVRRQVGHKTGFQQITNKKVCFKCPEPAGSDRHDQREPKQSTSTSYRKTKLSTSKFDW